MKKIVITGGAGFAGSHVTDAFLKAYPEAEIIVFDKMTYAADIRNLSHHLLSGAVRLVVGDLADIEACAKVVAGADLVIHAAAESHVDNSFGNSIIFTRTNVLGTHCLAEACRKAGVPRFIHISTDEVFGEVPDGEVDERAILQPTNPYSCSKAAAEMILQSYIKTYKQPIIIVRGNNLYGTRQHPEKLIPKFINLMLADRPLTIHGEGTARRHFLHVEDFADALMLLAEKGEIGETYNIGTHQEFSVIDIARIISAHFNKKMEDSIIYVEDRIFNDCRYSISFNKILSLGWKSKHNLEDDIDGIIKWSLENKNRYSDFMEKLDS